MKISPPGFHSDPVRPFIRGALTVMLTVGAMQAATAGALYTETNSAAGNSVVALQYATDGSLNQVASITTGGRGTEGGLGNSGALALDGTGHLLFAVNAGSNEISVIATQAFGMSLVDKVSSGGTQPVSLTVHGDLLYVLNSGGTGNITGFHIAANGHLQHIAGSTRPLSSVSAGAAQVQFASEGEQLIVSEKATNVIDVYQVENGLASGPIVHASHGQTPFGFAIDRRDHLIVSEAFGGADNASALSSYDLEGEGLGLPVISGTVPTEQTAACWVAIGGRGRFAYTTNTGSASVTGYRIGNAGTLTRLTSDGRTASAGAGPTDAAVNSAGQLLFVLSPPVGQIESYHVQADGTLVPAGSWSGLPHTATGLIAR